jgi:hypothetical protein
MSAAHWVTLPAGWLGSTASTAGMDANSVHADATAFRDFVRPGSVPGQIPVLMELARGETAKSVQSALPSGSVIPAAYLLAGTRYCTALLDPQGCRRLIRNRLGGRVERFEFQYPVIPRRAQPARGGPATKAATANPHVVSGSRTLIGVIDSGCPFAHPMLRDTAGTGTRVLRLWDQSAEPAFAAVGAPPSDFGYGCEVSRAEMNGLMADATRGGVIDEAACYEACGYLALRRAVGHGAGVLSLLFAPPPGSEPLSTRQAERFRDVDLAFVQLPADARQDSSSAGLPRLLLDGLRYIVDCARKTGAERVVVNISDGTSRGSHDGDALIERAMAAIIREWEGRGRRYRMHIVVAAGNSFDEQRHAQLRVTSRPEPGVVLCLPPNCETAAFVNVRVPPDASGVRLRVTPPGGRVSPWVRPGQALGWPSGSAPECTLVYPVPAKGRATCAQVSFAPTVGGQALGQPNATAGSWKFEVKGSGDATGPVHLHVPRNQRNLGALQRAFQPHFVDVGGGYDPMRPWRFLEDDPSPPASPIRRRGSLNGLGCGADGLGVIVVASRYRREPLDASPVKLHAPYSSAGPACGGSRKGPDVAAPVDTSRALRGICVRGNHGGELNRQTGTSFAAPQIARALAGGAWKPANAATPLDPLLGELPPPRLRRRLTNGPGADD